jgi:hypothetical protein
MYIPRISGNLPRSSIAQNSAQALTNRFGLPGFGMDSFLGEEENKKLSSSIFHTTSENPNKPTHGIWKHPFSSVDAHAPVFKSLIALSGSSLQTAPNSRQRSRAISRANNKASMTNIGIQKGLSCDINNT